MRATAGGRRRLEGRGLATVQRGPPARRGRPIAVHSQPAAGGPRPRSSAVRACAAGAVTEVK